MQPFGRDFARPQFSISDSLLLADVHRKILSAQVEINAHNERLNIAEKGDREASAY